VRLPETRSCAAPLPLQRVICGAVASDTTTKEVGPLVQASSGISGSNGRASRSPRNRIVRVARRQAGSAALLAGRLRRRQSGSAALRAGGLWLRQAGSAAWRAGRLLRLKARGAAVRAGWLFDTRSLRRRGGLGGRGRGWRPLSHPLGLGRARCHIRCGVRPFLGLAPRVGSQFRASVRRLLCPLIMRSLRALLPCRCGRGGPQGLERRRHVHLSLKRRKSIRRQLSDGNRIALSLRSAGRASRRCTHARGHLGPLTRPK